ncbi:MAG: winged helix-turn-helix transcriptional regulator [Methanomassiliicoccales archaeon]|nr:winged helix-turn-helix transcriptional regulator [Methanomassiliicoccales archaeon]NYT14920.1 winged helix-turn-helix transcriptional regulator [Methanomassiliicoccales archaeon]
MRFVNGERKSERSICLGEVNVLAPGEVVENVEILGGLDSLRSKLPLDDEIEKMAHSYKALADPIRIKVLWSLSLSDLCPCILKEILDLSDSKLSYHLNILESAGYIASRKEKNWRIYSLTERGSSVL